MVEIESMLEICYWKWDCQLGSKKEEGVAERIWEEEDFNKLLFKEFFNFLLILSHMKFWIIKQLEKIGILIKIG